MKFGITADMELGDSDQTKILTFKMADGRHIEKRFWT